MTENDSNTIPPQVDNLIGQRFSKLTVVSFAGTTSNGHAQWWCRCSCGAKKVIWATSLKTGHTKSCGCLENPGNKKHGMKNTQVYRVWSHIKDRCYRKSHPNYSKYGGRGIRVCRRWFDSFESFFSDMGHPPDDGKQYTLERIDNDGNYEPENCRWATRLEQANNKRNNRYITYGGKTRTLAQWGRETGINSHTILWRLNAGWPVSKALTKRP